MLMRPKRAFATAPRRSMLRRGIMLAGAAGAAWLIGLFWFAATLPTKVADETRPTDAIVVLTGGSGRIHQGLALLTGGRAGKLFVSGVYRGVDVQELLRVSQQSPEDVACCIALGYEADNTRGNAIETAAWMREQKLRSLRLVTSAYHMPRSLIEFRHFMPGIEIVPHPVFPEHYKNGGWWHWPGSVSVIATEYTKYLVAVIRDRVSGGPAQ
jgi:uncharacterized SAM-binding protein YcdF (DUF218 family)